MRKTLYGALTQDEELNENEKAMLYIKECAELARLEVIEGKTAIDIQFMAGVMKRLREKQEPCEDAISRQEVKEKLFQLWNCGDEDYKFETLRDFVAELPSVTPTRKKGRWIEEPNCWLRCSACGAHYPVTSIYGIKGYNFCPDCGEPKAESEDKE